MWYRSTSTQRAIRSAAKHTSAIVALYLPAEDAKELSLSGADSCFTGDVDIQEPEDLHITLAYLGKAADLGDKRKAIETVLKTLADRQSPVGGEVSGLGEFNGSGESWPLYASFDSAGVTQLRSELVEALRAIGIAPDQRHGFTPHITLAYLTPGCSREPFGVNTQKVTFGELTLCWGGKQTSFPFTA